MQEHPRSFAACWFLYLNTTPAGVFDDCSSERLQEGRGEVQHIQCWVACLDFIVLSVNQRVSSAKFKKGNGKQFSKLQLTLKPHIQFNLLICFEMSCKFAAACISVKSLFVFFPVLEFYLKFLPRVRGYVSYKPCLKTFSSTDVQSCSVQAPASQTLSINSQFLERALAPFIVEAVKHLALQGCPLTPDDV